MIQEIRGLPKLRCGMTAASFRMVSAEAGEEMSCHAIFVCPHVLFHSRLARRAIANVRQSALSTSAFMRYFAVPHCNATKVPVIVRCVLRRKV